MELCFFQEYLKRKFKIKDQNIKSGIARELSGSLIIFGHPGIGNTIYRGGDSCFSSKSTFVDLRNKIKNSQYLLTTNQSTEYIYICLTDKDKSNSEEKITSAKKYINEYCSMYKGEIVPLYATQEIETRFLAGLGKAFKKEYSGVNDEKLLEFLGQNNNIEDKENTKEILREILNQTALRRSTEVIGRGFGLYIDESMASEKCPSFKYFKEKLEELFGS